jgi:predicted CoA-binding protein
VNPNAREVEDDRSYPDLESIPAAVDAVIRTMAVAGVAWANAYVFLRGSCSNTSGVRMG